MVEPDLGRWFPATLTMRRWLSEPLVWFVLSGTVLFVLDRWIEEEAGRTIVVDDSALESFIARTQGFRDRQSAASWLQGVTRERFEEAVQAYVLEEALYREAIERRLDRDDLVIRSRLVTRLAQEQRDLAAREPVPPDAVVRHFEEHRSMYPPDVDLEEIQATVLEDVIAIATVEAMRTMHRSLLATYDVERDELTLPEG